MKRSIVLAMLLAALNLAACGGVDILSGKSFVINQQAVSFSCEVTPGSSVNVDTADSALVVTRINFEANQFTINSDDGHTVQGQFARVDSNTLRISNASGSTIDIDYSIDANEQFIVEDINCNPKANTSQANNQGGTYVPAEDNNAYSQQPSLRAPQDSDYDGVADSYDSDPYNDQVQ